MLATLQVASSRGLADLSALARIFRGQANHKVKAGGKLASLQTQLRRVSNDKDKGKYCVILCLVILLFILISMVLND